MLRSADGTGEWIPVGLMLPIVALAMADEQAEAKLREQKFPPVVFECTKLDTGRRRSIG